MKAFTRNFIRATLIGLAIYILSITILLITDRLDWSFKTFIEHFIINMVFSYALYFANGLAFDFVNKQIFKSQWNNPVKNLLVGVLASMVISTLVGFFLLLSVSFYHSGNIFNTLDWISTDNFSMIMERIIWFSLIVSLIFFFINYYQYTQKQKLESKEVIIQKVISSNEALKAQIGPHFLFNSLNVLSGLVDENPDKAQDFIADLSKVYRYVLEQNSKDLIPIQEELDFAKTYMNLIQTRFENGLSFELEEPLYQSEYQIIPLTLQLLLENCIKHNAISKSKPLKIRIYKNGKQLIVENNINPKRNLAEGTGTGLKNIQEKYKQLGVQQLNIQNNGQSFSVRIPLLTNRIIKTVEMESYSERDYLEAKERVQSIRGFYWNLAAYCLVNPYLTFLDLRHDMEWDWAYWPLIGWGIGLCFNAVHAFGWFNTANWEERKINDILEKKRLEREKFN